MIAHSLTCFEFRSHHSKQTQIEAAMATWSSNGRKYFEFWATILNFSTPDVTSSAWWDCGFIVCAFRSGSGHRTCDLPANTPREADLGKLYHRLIKLSTFSEFCLATKDHTLVKLFTKKGMAAELDKFPYTKAFLDPASDKDGIRYLSVWRLKRMMNYCMPVPQPGDQEMLCQYRIHMCDSNEKIIGLVQLYRTYFSCNGDDGDKAFEPRTADRDPLKLHNAMCEGRLWEHLKNTITVVDDDEVAERFSGSGVDDLAGQLYYTLNHVRLRDAFIERVSRWERYQTDAEAAAAALAHLDR